MRRALWALLLLPLSALADTPPADPAPAAPLSPVAQAFEDGKTFGAASNVTARGFVTTNSATGVVPKFSPTNPTESGYFGGGSGILSSFSATKISGCQTNPANPDAYKQQECDAINFLEGNPAQRRQFTIGHNDPLLTGGRSITANPTAIAGSFDGTYTGCSTRTVTTNAQYSTEVCNQYNPLEVFNCNKNLNVTVTWEWRCSPAVYTVNVGSGQLSVVMSCDSTESPFTTITVLAGSATQCHEGGCNSSYHSWPVHLASGYVFSATSGTTATTYDGYGHYTFDLTYDGHQTIRVRPNNSFISSLAVINLCRTGYTYIASTYGCTPEGGCSGDPESCTATTACPDGGTPVNEWRVVGGNLQYVNGCYSGATLIGPTYPTTSVDHWATLTWTSGGAAIVPIAHSAVDDQCATYEQRAL